MFWSCLSDPPAHVQINSHLKYNSQFSVPDPVIESNIISAIFNELNNYSLILSVCISNQQIQQENDFVYIVPDQTPFNNSYSQVNNRYKIQINKSQTNPNTATASYSIQNLALSEIYKLFYVRRTQGNELKLLYTTDKFKFIMRTKNNTTSRTQGSAHASNSGNESSCQLEIAQVFVSDPDFYRQNFDFEMHLLSQSATNSTITTTTTNTIHSQFYSNKDPTTIKASPISPSSNPIIQHIGHGQRETLPKFTNGEYIQRQLENIEFIGSENVSQLPPSDQSLTCSPMQFQTFQKTLPDQVNQTFLVDDTKSNDYIQNMNQILKQHKIEKEEKTKNLMNTKQHTNLDGCRSKSKVRTFSHVTSRDNNETLQSKALAQQVSNKQILASAPNKRKNRLLFDSPAENNSNVNISKLNQQTNETPQIIANIQNGSSRTCKESKENQFSNINNLILTPAKNTTKSASYYSSCKSMSSMKQSYNNSNNMNMHLNLSSATSHSQLNQILKSASSTFYKSSNTQSLHESKSSNLIKSNMDSTQTSNISGQVSSTARFHLRFEKDLQRMVLDKKVKMQPQKPIEAISQRVPEKKSFQEQLQPPLAQQGQDQTQQQLVLSVSSPVEGLEVPHPNSETMETPGMKKLYTVEEANSPFETSVNRFYTQKSSVSKSKITQTENNRIEETDELNHSQQSSELQQMRQYLRQFNKDLHEENSLNSSSLHVNDNKCSISAFYPEQSRQYNQNNIQLSQLSRREKTIQYLLPVYEYKLEKLGFEFFYDPKRKTVIIKDDKKQLKPNLLRNEFPIDERIKTDQLTNFFEDICASVAYQTIE